MKSPAKDHRVKVTQALIRKAYAELLAVKPIQSISIKELCERAGINRGTFYAHYQDIYQLKKSIEDEMYVDVQKALTPLLNENNPATQTEIMTGVFHWFKENRDMCAAILNDHYDRSFLWEVLQMGRMMCRESYLRSMKNVTTEQIEWYYRFVSGGLIAMLEKWLEEDMYTSVEQMTQMAVKISLHGADFLKS